jgi:2-oxoglutarate dehydrogenase complex dehydrogenase (E1) component-like enzyme
LGKLTDTGGVQTEGLESDSAAVTEARRAVMALLLHGDAAFAGQGVVAETLQLANTPGEAVACA